VTTNADGLLAARFAATRDDHDDSDWNDVLQRHVRGRRAQAGRVAVAAGSPASVWRRPSTRVGLLVAVITLAFLVATPAFGIGSRLWGLVNGTPVPPRSLGSNDWNALSVINNFAHHVRPKDATKPPRVKSLAKLDFVAITKVADRNGESFYVLKRRDGSSCYAEGPTRGFRARPTDKDLSLLAGIGCRPTYPFPSRAAPVFDMSVFHSKSFSNTTGVSGGYVWRLRGFAADPVSEVAVIGTDNVLRDETPVTDNVYSGTNSLPIFRPKQIVAFDKQGHRVYTQCVQDGGCK
jgi:hypothetical protein